MVALLKMPSRMTITPETADERRMFQRKEDHRHVRGRRLDHSVDARREPEVTVSLRDMSVGGIGAIVDRPLAAGERLAVFFPSEPGAMGFTASGRIVRCEPSSFGYRIGLAFDGVPMAA